MMLKSKKWKKIVSTLIAVGLILTAIPGPGIVNSVQAAENTILTVSDDIASTPKVLYEEDFEKEDYRSVTGASLATLLGYTPTNLDNNITDFAVVAEEGNSDNYVLKFGNHNVATATDTNVKLAFSEGVAKAVLQYRFKADATNVAGCFYLPRFGSGDNALENSRLNEAYFEINKYKANYFNAGTWYDVTVILDTEADKYDLYLNDRCLAAQISTAAAADGIEYFLLGVVGATDNVWYIDDIKVFEYVACESIAFNNPPTKLEVGASTTLTLTSVPANAYTRKVTYSSSNSEVATVDETGKVKAVSPGTATITATPYYTKGTLLADYVTGEPSWGEVSAATAEIVVEAAEVEEDVNTVSLPYHEDFEKEEYRSKTGVELAELLGYTPTNLDNNITDFAVVAEEGNSDNYVLKFGNHRVTEATDTNVKLAFPEGVTKAVLQYRFKAESISVNGSFYLPRFGSGNNNQLNNTRLNKNYIENKYSDDEFTKANPIGEDKWFNVTVILDTTTDKYDLYLNHRCLAAQQNTLGTAADNIEYFLFGVIGATDNVWYIDDIKVFEYVACENIAFDNPPADLAVGKSAELKLKSEPANAYIHNVKFSSSNPEVATVDETTGKVTAVSIGETTITVAPYWDNGSTIKTDTPPWGNVPAATTTISVRAAVVNEIAVEDVMDNAITLPEGGHMYLKTKTLPDETEILYSSDNKSVATVDEWGEIVAVGEGTANITLQSVVNPSVTKTIAVTVEKVMGVDKTIYVSPAGSSTGEGTSSDKVTIQRAMELVAANNDNMTGNIEVILDDGYYQQTDTIAFTEAHSGTNNYSVIWRAAEGAEPVIGGGIHLAGSAFTACTEEGLEGVYVAPVPDYVQTRQLYVNNVRATRARSEGSLLNPVFDKSYGYICDNTEFLTYHDITDLELVWYQNWTNSRCGVASVEETADGKVKLTMDQPGWSNVTNKGSATDTKATTEIAWYENALELLDEPGEWYLDEEADKLYYMPRQWENSMEDITVTIPEVEELVTIQGADCDNLVENIRFEGITFADTTWMRPSTNMGHCEIQNNHLRENASINTDRLPDAAIVVKKANSIYFTDCTFTRMGITALKMVDGVQNSPIKDNHFYDISGSAITIGEPGVYTDSQKDNYYPDDARNVMKNCDVLNNYIHDVAVDYHSAAAVSVAYAADMNLSHNEIFHIPYSAFHIGYGWDKVFDNVLKNMVISNNFIHDIFESKVYDGGAIYTLGNTGDGDGSYNVISDNYIKRQMMGPGVLYPDNGSTYWKLSNNVIDLSEVEAWTGGNVTQRILRWAFVNAPAKHIHFNSIYTTVPTHGGVTGTNAEASDVTYTNIHTCDASNWPTEALAIINASGLQGDNAAARRAGQAERIVTNIEGEKVVDVGTEISISTKYTDGKDNAVNGGEITLYYEVDDPSVVEIQDSKLICKKVGKTTVRLYVVSNDILDIIEGEFYVGDTLKELKLEDFESDLEFVEGITGKQLTPYVITDMGRNPEITAVTYEITDSTLATVDANGFLVPLKAGETTLTITATAEGKSITGSFKVIITEAPTYDDLVITNADELFKAENEDKWVKSGADIWEFTDDTQIVTKVNSKYATYGGKRYEDELLSFKLNVGSSAGWPSLAIRAQDTTYMMAKEGSNGYRIGIQTTGIELDRWNNGSRTWIYGNGEGAVGGPIDANLFKQGETHDVIVGAVDVEDGVRIILIVDGVTVIDYIDTSEDAFKDSGYFGVLNGTFTLTKNVEETIEIEIDDSSEAAGTVVTAPEGGWKTGSNTFTVTSEKASMVLVSNDGGVTYERLAATKAEGNAENCYSFTVENVAADTQITVAVAGDVNGDGKVSTADAVRLRAASLGKVTVDDKYALIGDVNGDDKISTADAVKVRAASLGKTSLGW